MNVCELKLDTKVTYMKHFSHVRIKFKRDTITGKMGVKCNVPTKRWVTQLKLVAPFLESQNYIYTTV